MEKTLEAKRKKPFLSAGLALIFSLFLLIPSIADALRALTNQGGQCASSHRQSTAYQLTVKNYDLSAVGERLANQVNVILRTAYTDGTAVAHDITIQVRDGAELSKLVESVN